jgi:NAD(P)-dependent dehydrogenase (short-subunit alcohol dehydrogenase family)
MLHAARVALITGCGKAIGIGSSTARALAAKGVTVVVSDLRPEGVANAFNAPEDTDANWGGIDALAEEIAKSGGTASSVLGDVSRETDAKRMVAEVLARYGRLDILVNNACAPQGADRNEIEDVPVDAWDLTMGVNAKGAFLMTRARVCPQCERRAGQHRQRAVEGGVPPRSQARHLCRLEGRDRRPYAGAGAGAGTLRDHHQCGLPRPDPHLARDQHQLPRIWRRPRSRSPRAGEGNPGRPLRQPGRGRLGDCLSDLGRSRVRDRPSHRRHWWLGTN